MSAIPEKTANSAISSNVRWSPSSTACWPLTGCHPRRSVSLRGRRCRKTVSDIAEYWAIRGVSQRADARRDTRCARGRDQSERMGRRPQSEEPGRSDGGLQNPPPSASPMLGEELVQERRAACDSCSEHHVAAGGRRQRDRRQHSRRAPLRSLNSGTFKNSGVVFWSRCRSNACPPTRLPQRKRWPQ